MGHTDHTEPGRLTEGRINLAPNPLTPPEIPAGCPFHKLELLHNNLTSATNPDMSFTE